MKSAYEIAMAKLEQSSGPSKKLSDEQKVRIAEIETKYEARIAESKMGFDARIAGADSLETLNTVKEEMGKALQALEAKREEDKNRIWNED